MRACPPLAPPLEVGQGPVRCRQRGQVLGVRGKALRLCGQSTATPWRLASPYVQALVHLFRRAMSACLYEHDYRLTRLVNTWFWHAVRCQVRVLSLKAYDTGRFVHQRTLALDDRPIDSRHLMRLDLHSVVVGRRFLNFSNCPSLEHLKLQSCYFESENDSRLHICAPSLVSLSLILDYIWALIPSLESMPSLLKAAVTTEHSSEFCNLSKNCNCEFCHNSYSIGDDTSSNDCVLLKGLSEAKDLALISGPETFIFKRDLRWCPMFSNLKTLLLNDYWCVLDDFRSLVCILEHSPVLEKLTLELFSKKHRQQRERKGILRPMEVSAVILEHLKIIEVRCHALERIRKLSLFLCAFHIRFSFN